MAWNKAKFYVASKVFHVLELSELIVIYDELIVYLKFNTKLVELSTLEVWKRRFFLKINQYIASFCDKENLSKQEWIPLVQLTHKVDISTPNVLHQKWHFITDFP